MNDFMAEHVIGFAEAGSERQHDPAAFLIRHTADALAEEARHDVGLRELRVARVQDDRLPFGELVVQRRGEPRVPTLGETRGLDGGVMFRGIVMDVEMRCLEYTEVQCVVVDLVASKRLRSCRACDADTNTHRQADDAPQHGIPRAVQREKRAFGRSTGTIASIISAFKLMHVIAAPSNAKTSGGGTRIRHRAGRLVIARGLNTHPGKNQDQQYGAFNCGASLSVDQLIDARRRPGG